MAKIQKSPQELAAQIIEAYPVYSDLSMPKKHVAVLSKQAREIKQEVEALKPYLLPDKELTKKLNAIKKRAKASGVWEPQKGEGAEERIAFVIKTTMGFGYSKDEATTQAMKDLKRDGYLSAIVSDKREKEQVFKEPIDTFLQNHKSLGKVEEIKKSKLNVIDLSRLSVQDRRQLTADFPTGNFVYHGTNTEQLIKILESGYLSNSKALYEAEQKAAKRDGRETDFMRRNSGYEGISWSLNSIDALPGDRYHLAGFVTAPELILGNNEQLAVPSRPALYEVIQINDSINASKFYEAKTQLELYSKAGVLGEANSVFNNLWAVSYWLRHPRNRQLDEPLFYTATRKLLKQKDIAAKLRSLYSIETDGHVHLSNKLLGQIDDEVPVAIVWLQAALDTNKLAGTVFSGKTLPEIVAMLNGKNIDVLLSKSKLDWQSLEKYIQSAEKKIGSITVPVEQMYFVAARKDITLWLKVIARMPHQPAGILLYDDNKVRLENFATTHRGDHAELSRELRQAIPAEKGYIDYESVLGTRLTDDMRAGHHHQIIADYLIVNKHHLRKHGTLLKLEP